MTDFHKYNKTAAGLSSDRFRLLYYLILLFRWYSSLCFSAFSECLLVQFNEFRLNELLDYFNPFLL